MVFTIRLHEAPEGINKNYPHRIDDKKSFLICYDVPGKWAICGCCHGAGQHCHNIDGNGLSSEMEQDPEFMEAYRAGLYDKPCEECGGSGKIIVPDENRFNEDQKILMDAWNEHCASESQYRALVAAERAHGQGWLK